MDLYLRIMQWIKSEEGQDLVEYALLVALIALACILAVTLGGQAIQTVWTNVTAALGGLPT
jgi:Flp pilus assembly pilin Flp